MRQFTKHVRGWRWLPITACVLVFLFAFHAKTAAYGDGLNVKPHTATSSKLWIKGQKIPKPQTHSSCITYRRTFDFGNPVAGRSLLQIQRVTSFVTALCFSGLSPPLTLLETS